MWYVYILRSKSSNWYYGGLTDDLRKRFTEHNEGLSQATKHYVPFELESYVALRTKEKAAAVEQYFKTGSGRAFWRKRLVEED